MQTRRAERGGLDAIPDVDEMRAMYRTFAAFFPARSGVEARAVDAGGLAVEWIEPADAGDAAPTLLYLHGGGYVIGGCDTHRNMVGHLARELGGRAPRAPAPLTGAPALVSTTPGGARGRVPSSER